MELDLSPPHLSSSPEDACPAPGTPPETPPPPDNPPAGDVKRSQPLPIPSSRKLREEELQVTSLPSIPNPFPELCSPPSQKPILGGSSSARGLLSRDSSRLHVVKVYSEDGTCRSVEVAAGATARHVCEMLVQRAHALGDESWGLVECHPYLALEKMVSSCLDAQTGTSHEDLIQNFLNAGSFPEIQGFLQLRGSGRGSGRKLWKRFFCFLRRSGLYYSTKGTSKDPRHLQYVADVNESNAYVVTQGRKLYGVPTDFGFCVKPNKLRNGHKGLHIFCSEDEQSRTCWLTAFRLFKYGMQLYKNYQQTQSRHLRLSYLGSSPLRSVSDNTLVAMDFSGHAGRVIENPREALSAAMEEAQAWRKKTNHRLSLPTPCSGSSLSAAIHRTQPWFHGRISREESQRLIGQQGLVDGPGKHDLKSYYAPPFSLYKKRGSIAGPKGCSSARDGSLTCPLATPQSEDEGCLYFSMDDGQTRFTDLLQLVEFHQLNRGILPCVLRHCCARVAL
ncbi:Growth factor receptor-bound protein 7 [Cricetulus griseus]|uniref:Growth factor receptor-bound protein 7 n=1 Tax=Cricetulus griseus TaxID=10029 RepID=G3H5Y2_CRIGR|nr:Growth factor receptor-bound protein 7 [Cricetulus griseus]